MSGYASFTATHEERLVRSLVAETGLPHARAKAVAAAVLAGAWERGVTFPDGAAYGWLRVAARHFAADPTSAWGDAADAAVAQAHSAAVALAALPPSQRELLRLRYVDGLLPAAIAERLGTSVADVRSRLDSARTGATRRIARPTVTPYLRTLAAAALAAAAAATLIPTSGQSTPLAPPAAAGLPSYALPHAGLDPVDAVRHLDPATHAMGAVRADASYDEVVVPDEAVPAALPCRLPKTCLGEEKMPGKNAIVVNVPDQVGDVTGENEVVVKQDSRIPMDLCDTMPSPPAGVARCEHRKS
jgi:DNA-directed RNA polymerase specialized sigma24 family protein